MIKLDYRKNPRRSKPVDHKEHIEFRNSAGRVPVSSANLLLLTHCMICKHPITILQCRSGPRACCACPHHQPD